MTASPSAPRSAADPTADRREGGAADDETWHHDMLRELAGIGMDLARVVQRQALAAPEPDKRDDAALAYARIARAVRQTVALYDRLRQGEAATPAAPRRAWTPPAPGAWRVPAEPRAPAEREPCDADEAPESDDEDLLADLHEDLAAPSTAAELAGRTRGEIVAGICRDLGLPPERALRDEEAWGLPADPPAAAPPREPGAAGPVPTGQVPTGPEPDPPAPAAPGTGPP
jgi:hypothetical protein